MFFDKCFAFDILEVLKFIRKENFHKTKKRNISTLSCRMCGRSVFTQNHEEINVETAGVLFIPAGSEYTQKSEYEEVIAIHLKVYGENFEGMQYYSCESDNFIPSTFHKIYEEWSSKKSGYQQRCSALLYGLLADIAAQRSRNGKSRISKILDSVTYMKTNFAKPDLSVAEIAAVSGISEIYFRKIWVTLYDESPARYLTGIRIKFAKALLLETDDTVAEIARLSGFYDSKYFSTKFKKITGKSPSEYRKAFEVSESEDGRN